MNTLEYITAKYKINIGRRYDIEIPNMGRNNLAELFGELGFTKGAEIGVEQGFFSEVLCKANPNLHLFSIDPWLYTAYDGTHGVEADQKPFDDRYEETKARLKNYNCTIIRKTSMDTVNDFEDNSLDFVYIDANHEFVNFINDLHYWRRKVRAGGIVSGHDYANFPFKKFNHVKKALDAYAASYAMFPYFLVGSIEYRPGEIRDRYRSWFWVKE